MPPDLWLLPNTQTLDDQTPSPPDTQTLKNQCPPKLLNPIAIV